MLSPLDYFKKGIKAIRGGLILCVLLVNGGNIWRNGDIYQYQKINIPNHHTIISADQRQSLVQSLGITRINAGISLQEVSDTTGSPGQQIRFEKISIEDGLSQSSVYSIYQDSTGFLWFGTEDGLNKFDGYNFTVYRHDPDDPLSLSDNSILSIFEDGSGELWIGTYGRGLNRFDREKEQFKRFRHNPDNPNSLINDNVNVINVDSSGRLWVGTMDGLDRYDSESDKFIHYQSNPEILNGLSHNTITAIHQDLNGILWIGTFGGGLNRYDPTTDQFFQYSHDILNPNTISSDYVSSISEDQSGIIWIGTADGGLNKFNPKTEEFNQYLANPQYSNSLSQNSISSIDVDHLGNIWIGSDGSGIDVFNPSSEQFQNFKNEQDDLFSLSQDLVTEIYVDRSGIVWIGTFGGGVNKFDPLTTRFIHYRHISSNLNSLSSNNVMSITENEAGNLWIGLFGGGLDRINRSDGTVIHYRNDPNDPGSLASDDVWYVYPDQSNLLWVGTIGGGLDRFDTNTGEFTHFVSDPDDPDSLSINAVTTIYEDRDNMLWIGTSGGGLDRFDRKTEKFFHFVHDPDEPSSLSNNRIWTITEDRAGNLWVGTGGGGISVLDQKSGKFVQYLHDPDDPNSLGDTDIFSIYEDSGGSIWIGTYGSGLDKFDPATGEFIHYRVSDGLPNNVVYGILEDENGYLWLSTNLGLSSFDPRTESFKNFEVSDGLQSNEFNVGAHYIDEQGEMYFGGINGLTSFHPEDIQDTELLPSVLLTALKQGGEDILIGKAIENLDEITLDRSNNNFEFEFAALNYSHPEKSQYAYILEGFDENWNFIGKNRNGRYTNLPGGTYTLRLKATNSDGIWNENGASITVKVVPPFWETWWFIGIITLIVLASVVSGYMWRVRTAEARSQELEDQVRTRTEEIDRRRIELEALYQADEVIDQFLTIENRLKALVDVAIDILHADKSSIFIWDEVQEKFVIKVSRGFSSQVIQSLAIGKDEGVIGEAANTGVPVIVDDGSKDPRKEMEQPEYVDLILAEGIRSFMFLPIKISDEIFGIFNVNFCEPNSIGEEEIRVFMALTQHSALSIQNAQLFEQLRELAIKEERSRLARDLHDSAKQKAFAALAQLGAASGMIDRKPAVAKDHLIEAEDLVHEVLQELIILIQEMYPVTLRERGLAASVREYVFEWENQCEIEAEVTIINERKLPLEIEQSLYRVIQESLANIARHSQAKQVNISITYNSDTIEVQISDNGVGFDINQKPSGLGLRSMDERIELINGEFDIKSEPGAGTRIKVVAPVEVGVKLRPS
ncbi:two-component regulator propeller domain-containing protein [Chloroflexota bacterium]